MVRANQTSGNVRSTKRKRAPAKKKTNNQLLKDSKRAKVSDGDFRRLARKGGIKRISKLSFPRSKLLMPLYLDKILHDAVVYTKHAKRSTITTFDIVNALKRHGATLYGF